ncbi:aromatic ring-hydroxylating dioxygenase subunit alpha [Sphingomonas sp. CL5.1]|uniref:aromatic ring-hydroxylating oxygenase subunit alpha n=1 Tax=Sphingomonas sp. CL5.1 TaxID=2653203 RepID=UPI0015815C35|nr:aromatic ring-hydroxylating dioxygenase subunit alpha [Sphingomonas sp. CL5.1]QKR98388.1 aromatic ring-hydroxylating dioxygenase subunit alpha [Sphingomonas sp. CL5.1]
MATDVALDTEALDRLVDLIRVGGTDLAEATLIIPTEHFTSPERLTREIALLRSRPLVVGHLSDVPEPSSFFTRTVLGIPLLVVRQKDGSVAAFRNMCRHRGGRVEQAESGRKGLFMCQYHGWSYAAEGGALKAVPYEETAGGIDRGCNGLIRFPCAVRHGLVFVTLTEDAPIDLPGFIGAGIDTQIAPWNLDSATVLMEHWIPLEVNWKLVMDGSIDSLHAQFLHPKPGGVGSRTVNHSAVFREFGAHGKMFMARAKLKRMLDAGEEIDATSRYVGTVMSLYPNNVLVEAPDHIELWSVWPDIADPGRCTVRIRFMVRPEIMSPEMAERITKSWDILRQAGMEEDFPMEAWIQENAAAWPGGTFRYGSNEKSAQHLHRQLHRDIDGGIVGEGTISFVAQDLHQSIKQA